MALGCWFGLVAWGCELLLLVGKWGSHSPNGASRCNDLAMALVAVMPKACTAAGSFFFFFGVHVSRVQVRFRGLKGKTI